MKEKSHSCFRAFIYSLDAFIALLIVTFIISMLSFFSSLFSFKEPLIYQLKLLSLDVYNVYLYSKINNLSISCEDLGNLIKSKGKYYFTIKCGDSIIFSDSGKKAGMALVKDTYLVIYYDKGESKNNVLACKQQTTADDLGSYVFEFLEVEIGI